MFDWMSHPLVRRGFLGVGSAGLAGLSLPALLAAEGARVATNGAGVNASADATITIFLSGGPSHHDTWDMKPDAPAEIRGEFQPIASSLPGVPVCEHLPKLAPHMHRCTLVRSVQHSVNNAHGIGVYTSLTGHDKGERNVNGNASANDWPAMGSMVSKSRPPERPIVPFVHLPYITQEGAGGPPQPGFFGGALGKMYDPLFVTRDPGDPAFSIPELALQPDVGGDRFSRRRSLRGALDGGFTAPDARVAAGLSGFQQRAIDLLASSATQEAFRLSLEPAATRDAYGRNIYGQSVLLARRLVEAGTRAVTISWAPDANSTWDTHGGNFQKLKTTLLPQLDAALSSLLGDLVERGLLERTLVLVMGEFGRTPKINANAGRDHWNFCYSVLMAGGGMKPGVVFGASDKIGGLPASNPTSPAEIIATAYAALGLPAETEFHDALGRPFQLVPWGEPIRAILG
jgi:hypothetical protein